ncbi:S4 domain-containing protein YaaA [Gorillibacterium sp. sgz5001074]|uniref:S4 domain-containing protein YaaA n=1 Tax=Gorillibacterium sp. sgz5001074 TaxID=3446695 RepID=UPI003F66CF2A
MTVVPIRGEYITLGQFLKITDIISSGGEAKLYLAEAKILVNGEPDNRRGRKLYPNDTVKVGGVGEFRVTAEQN